MTDQNELVMCTSENVLVYTREGNLKQTIKEEHFNRNVTYSHQTTTIEIIAQTEQTSISICSYSENDEVERLYVPVKDGMIYRDIFHHPAGPGVILIYQGYKGHDSSIVFI